MKKEFSILLGAAVLFAAGTLSAKEVKTFNKSADWNKNAAVVESENGLKASARAMLISPKFTIDPKKSYTIKYSVCAQNIQKKDYSWCLGGFEIFDKNGKSIRCVNVAIIPGTMTEVAADAAKGAQTLTVKDGSKFRKGGHFYLLSGAKADLSDLPNNNIIGSGVKNVQKKDDVWEITLNNKLAADVKAGTVIREHHAGGYLYTAGSRNVYDKWSTMQGKIKGYSKSGWAGSKWPVGAVSARFIIMLNWHNRKLETLLKDVSMTIE